MMQNNKWQERKEHDMAAYKANKHTKKDQKRPINQSK